MFTVLEMAVTPDINGDETARDSTAPLSARASAVRALVAARHPSPATRLLAARAIPQHDSYWLIEPATRELQMVDEVD